ISTTTMTARLSERKEGHQGRDALRVPPGAGPAVPGRQGRRLLVGREADGHPPPFLPEPARRLGAVDARAPGVGPWRRGRRGDQLEAMHGQVLEAAGAAGPSRASVTELQATCWSAFTLYKAACTAAREEADFSEVAAKAGLAAFQARQASSDAGVTPEAIEY